MTKEPGSRAWSLKEFEGIRAHEISSGQGRKFYPRLLASVVSYVAEIWFIVR